MKKISYTNTLIVGYSTLIIQSLNNGRTSHWTVLARCILVAVVSLVLTNIIEKIGK